MNRKILIMLVIVAVALYSYVAFLLAGGSFSPSVKKDITKTKEDLFLGKLVLNAIPVRFEIKGRDPFLQYKERPATVSATVVKQRVKAITKKDPPKHPLVTITGIMWNPTNPVAMVNMPGGASIVARPGLVAGNITFRKIEQNRIQVSSDGKEFWIER